MRVPGNATDAQYYAAMLKRFVRIPEPRADSAHSGLRWILTISDSQSGEMTSTSLLRSARNLPRAPFAATLFSAEKLNARSSANATLNWAA